MKNKSLFCLLGSLLFTLYSLRPAYAGLESYYGKFYADGSPKKAEFALTYDDGPGLITGDLLELLKKYGAKATFFMTGGAVRKYPEKAAKAAAAGHLLGNHTDTHANYFQADKKPEPEKFLEKELDGAAAAIEKATGKKTVFLRMPNGYDRKWVRKVAAEKGYILVNWSYGSDWTGLSEDAMTAGYLKNVRPGAILLLHDGGGKSREKTLRITEKALQEAARKGLKAVALDELLGIGLSGDKPKKGR
jgi:peptidoglycan/xylan/chitin deacetylase (PgdA/CDA1 family)